MEMARVNLGMDESKIDRESKMIINRVLLDMKIVHEDKVEDHKRDIYKWLKVSCK